VNNSSSSHPQFQSLHWICHGQDGNQFWFYTSLGEIRQEMNCLDYSGQNELKMWKCHGQKGNQEWEFHGDVRNKST
jgi:polypeptide N-acetylgalactosaminyltransferase